MKTFLGDGMGGYYTEDDEHIIPGYDGFWNTSTNEHYIPDGVFGGFFRASDNSYIARDDAAGGYWDDGEFCVELFS